MRVCWQQLLNAARRGLAPPPPREIATIANELSALAPRAIDAHPYSRLLLHQSDDGEVLLARWRRDGRSAAHDHGGATGLVFVLEGRFHERQFEFSNDELCAVRERKLSLFEANRVARETIHDMLSRDEGLTLHVYFPCVREMQLFDATSRSTFLVGSDSGAWLPEPSAIHAARSWD